MPQRWVVQPGKQLPSYTALRPAMPWVTPSAAMSASVRGGGHSSCGHPPNSARISALFASVRMKRPPICFAWNMCFKRALPPRLPQGRGEGCLELALARVRQLDRFLHPFQLSLLEVAELRALGLLLHDGSSLRNGCTGGADLLELFCLQP